MSSTEEENVKNSNVIFFIADFFKITLFVLNNSF